MALPLTGGGCYPKLDHEGLILHGGGEHEFIGKFLGRFARKAACRRASKERKGDALRNAGAPVEQFFGQGFVPALEGDFDRRRLARNVSLAVRVGAVAQVPHEVGDAVVSNVGNEHLRPDVARGGALRGIAHDDVTRPDLKERTIRCNGKVEHLVPEGTRDVALLKMIYLWHLSNQ